MTIQRCTVKGRIAGIVETRTVFTADITIVAGDEPHDYWNPYLESIYSELNSVLSSVYVSYAAEVTIPDAGHWVSLVEFPYYAGGNVSGDYLPNAVAGVLIAKAPGLRHVGRKFFGPIPESLATANSLVAGAVTDMAAALLAYITPLTTILGSVLTPGVVDKTGAFHAFTGGVVASLLGSMRRRKPGLGI